MFGTKLDKRENYASPRRSLASLGLGFMLALTGCNQNPTGTGSTAWINPFAPNYGASTNPTSQQYLDDMRRQSQQQYQLAMEQQRRLAELEAMNRQSDQQLAQMRQQEQLAKQRAFEQEEQQEALVTQRAREFLGRYDDLGQRRRSLDQNNQDLHAQIAKVQQRTQLLEDQNQLLRQRLDDTSRQLAWRWK